MKKQNKKTVVIHTKKWCRYDLCNKHGSCCALGFAGKQLYGDPMHFDTASSFLSVVSVKVENDGLYDVYDVTKANDWLYGPKRRKVLRELFKKVGYKLIFKD